MIEINYFMSHGSPWTFLGHNRLGKIIKKFNVKLNMYPVNYGEIFPISGGLPVSKRPPQRQKLRLQELKRWGEFLRVNLIPQPKFFPSKSLLPSLIIIAAKIKKTNKDFDLAQNIMNALWVQDLDIDDENSNFSFAIPTNDHNRRLITTCLMLTILIPQIIDGLSDLLDIHDLFHSNFATLLVLSHLKWIY